MSRPQNRVPAAYLHRAQRANVAFDKVLVRSDFDLERYAASFIGKESSSLQQ
jgi:hypothetical protein